METTRQARATWSGNLAEGSGTVASGTSGAFPEMPITWKARTEESGGVTSPEELLAAAHAACFSMAFSNELSKAGFVPDRVGTTASILFRKLDAWTVVFVDPRRSGEGAGHRQGEVPGDRGTRQGDLPDLTSHQRQRPARRQRHPGAVAGL